MGYFMKERFIDTLKLVVNILYEESNTVKCLTSSFLTPLFLKTRKREMIN